MNPMNKWEKCLFWTLGILPATIFCKTGCEKYYFQTQLAKKKDSTINQRTFSKCNNAIHIIFHFIIKSLGSPISDRILDENSSFVFWLHEERDGTASSVVLKYSCAHGLSNKSPLFLFLWWHKRKHCFFLHNRNGCNSVV